MADILDIADCVREYLADFGPVVSFFPEYDLADLGRLRAVVVPVGIGRELRSRSEATETRTVQIGFLKKATEDEIPGLVRLVSDVAASFLGMRVMDSVCTSQRFEPLYSPEHLRERGQFTSVLELEFQGQTRVRKH